MRGRVIRYLSVVAVLVLAVAGAAMAAATSVTLLSAQALTGSSNSAPAVAVRTIVQAEVKVLVTAVSGTTPQLDLWLESCQDTAGSNCVPLLADTVGKDANPPTASNPTVTTNARDIVDAKTSTTSETFTARYDVIPAGYVRLRWVISGTTPSFTTAVYLNGK